VIAGPAASQTCWRTARPTRAVTDRSEQSHPELIPTDLATSRKGVTAKSWKSSQDVAKPQQLVRRGLSRCSSGSGPGRAAAAGRIRSWCVDTPTGPGSACCDDKHFTVVTGPPGTGKSQVLVNVVAAAVADGQSVLSIKNKQGRQRVLERVREVSTSRQCDARAAPQCGGELAVSMRLTSTGSAAERPQHGTGPSKSISTGG